jgi:hypothetical protein
MMAASHAQSRDYIGRKKKTVKAQYGLRKSTGALCFTGKVQVSFIVLLVSKVAEVANGGKMVACMLILSVCMSGEHGKNR